jgi:two-component system cell cycle sensor histidine kinase/response regulator CckA
MLEAIGYTLLTAESGKEAIDLYRQNRDIIDLVLLDVVMPDMGGGETYRPAQKTEPRPQSASRKRVYKWMGEATRILKRGCQGFIQKPLIFRKYH